MRHHLTSRSAGFFTLVAIAAIGLACSASASRADFSKMLHGLKAAPAVSGDVLPAVSDPSPYRQLVQASCNRTNPFGGGSTACILVFDKVAASRVLQIENVNCLGGFGVSGVLIFNTNLDLAHLTGFAVQPQSGFATAQGPYYFKAAERPKILTEGAAPTSVAICSIFGTLWQTN